MKFSTTEFYRFEEFLLKINPISSKTISHNFTRKFDVSLHYFDYVYIIISMTENKSLFCARLAARLEDL